MNKEKHFQILNNFVFLFTLLPVFLTWDQKPTFWRSISFGMQENLSKVGTGGWWSLNSVWCSLWRSSGEEINQRLESSAEFCAEAVGESFAARSKINIPLAFMHVRYILQLALASSTFTSRSLQILVLQNVF